jgi:hypothetical protein
VLEDKPVFDPKALQDAIDTLVSNEEVDDEAVAALENALKAIDLTPYAKTTDVDASIKTLEDGATKLAKDLSDAVKALQDADQVRLVAVVRDHKPTDAEIDGSWGLWQSQVADPPNAKINFFLWVREGNYAQQLLVEDSVVPWEALAKFDATRQTYSLPVEGATLEYNKEPISVLGNQTFDPPALLFNFKDADTVFNNIAYKAYNAENTEIGNGGRLVVPGENLTVVSVNPVLIGTGSSVITKVIFDMTRLDSTILRYEVLI